ncbi:MAG: PAS domain-containing protein [Myxococcales bacterium]|nr:PAS domain-containing protein [Myxococcales bacterium]
MAPSRRDPTSSKEAITAEPPGPASLHHAALADVLPVAACLLDRSGLVAWHNRAFAELLQRPAAQIDGEPFLGWLGRSSEREGFGRAFMAMREREAGASFAIDAGLSPRLGPAASCRIRAVKLDAGTIGLSCLPVAAAASSPEAELGLAVTRGLDALEQGVLLVDGDARVMHCNPAATQLLGDGLVGRSVLELVEGGQVGALTRGLTVARGGSWQGELNLRRHDGESVPVDVSIAAGSGPRVVLVRDLRERRRREFEARVSGQVDRALVSRSDPRDAVAAAAAALGTAIVASHVVLLVRHGEGERVRWRRWTVGGGALAREVPLSAAPPASWEVPGVVDGEPEDEAGRAAIGPAAEVRASLRVALRGPSGTLGYLWLGRTTAGPWDARDQALVGTVAAQLGLGLEGALLSLATRELADYQTLVLDQSAVLIDTVDEAGRVVTWNRASAQLLGIPAEAAIGRRFGLDVAVATDEGAWTELWSALLRDGGVTREVVLRAQGGAELPVHLEARLMRQAGGVRGAVLVGLDLRDRRALESQILRSQKLAAVGLLAAGIAHEINNPLSGVVGYSQLLLERPLSADVREKVEKIAQSGERCRKIVEGVLLFSRKQDGGERRNVDLRALLDRVLSIGEYQWRMHNIRILREQDEPACVFADADQIEQVVLNLLSNAVDAMPRGGSIRLRLAALPAGTGPGGPSGAGGAKLTISDEGHGIPQEIQARIFDPFFSTKEIGKGTGLGLAISYGIVQDHGGDIVVESAPGQGATFTVLLPSAPPGPAQSTSDAPNRQGR